LSLHARCPPQGQRLVAPIPAHIRVLRDINICRVIALNAIPGVWKIRERINRADKVRTEFETIVLVSSSEKRSDARKSFVVFAEVSHSLILRASLIDIDYDQARRCAAVPPDPLTVHAICPSTI